MYYFKMSRNYELFVIVYLVLTSSNVLSGKVPTVYDVLQLVYQVCSTEESHRQQSLNCVSQHLGKEVSSAMHRCMSEDKNTTDDNTSVKMFCEQLTHVTEWVSKHKEPPQQLTRVMGLAALGRMACVLGEVQRPLPMWQATFAKCFPEYKPSTSKESTKNRKDNVFETGS